MKELYKRTSTNGRWGLAVCCENEIQDLNVAQRGNLTYLGSINHVDTYLFDLAEDGTLFLLNEDDVDCLGGATIIKQMDLQSSNVASIVALGDGISVIKEYGYKRRSSRIKAFSNGKPINLPDTVLLAMGIIKPKITEKIVPEIPEINPAMLEALKAAGLA